MKKRTSLTGIILSLVLLILCVNPGIAQKFRPIKKGTHLFGGNFHGAFKQSQKSNGSENSVDIGLYPNYGYFVMKGLAFGASPYFSFEKVYKELFTSNKRFGFGLFLKYYFDSGIFINSFGSYGYEEEILDPRSLSSDKYYLNVVPGFGYSFLINNHLTLELSLNYDFEVETIVRDDSNSETPSHELFIMLGFQNFFKPGRHRNGHIK